jgi:hypothetical protein
VQVEQVECNQRHDRRLDDRDHCERERVAEKDVELRDRHRHQTLERSGHALAQHRHRGDDEHRDEREDSEHRAADPVEHLRLRVEQVPEQCHE